MSSDHGGGLQYSSRTTLPISVPGSDRTSIPIAVPEPLFPIDLPEMNNIPPLMSQVFSGSKETLREQNTTQEEYQVKEDITVKLAPKTDKIALLKSSRHESVVDEQGIVRLEKQFPTNKAKTLRQSSFELPSILQNLFHSTVSCTKDSSNEHEGKASGSISGISSILPLRLSQENLASGYSKFLYPRENRPRSYSLDKFKLIKSDSKNPLLDVKPSASKSHYVGKENLQPETNLILPTSESSCIQNESPRKTSIPKVSTGKQICKICAKESTKIQRVANDPKLRGQSTASVNRRRETLRPQGSLDSAQSDRTSTGSLKGWNPSLTRSGSLDLDMSWKEDSLLESMGLCGGETSLSTSQDSLQSDTGGAPTLHRYYHVFRDRELDQLIEKYVQNLHIISSYYDHANWCIIAEKVQVWTI